MKTVNIGICAATAVLLLAGSVQAASYKVSSSPAYIAEVSPAEGSYDFEPGDTLVFTAPSGTFDNESLLSDVTFEKYVIDYADGTSVTGTVSSVTIEPLQDFSFKWHFTVTEKQGLEPVSLRYIGKYVQDGLVGMYDAVYNQGTNVARSTSTATWTDVSGNGRDMTPWLDGSLAPAWGENYAEWTGGNVAMAYHAGNSASAVIDSSTNVTFEIAGEKYQAQGNNVGIFLMQNGSEKDYTAVPFGARYYASNIYMNRFGTQTPPTSWCYGPSSGGPGSFDVSFVGMSAGCRLYHRDAEKAAIGGSKGVFPVRGWVVGGGGGTYAYGLKMKAYNIRIYNRALSEAEIAHNDMIDSFRYYGNTGYGDGVMKVSYEGCAAGSPVPGYGNSAVTVGGKKVISVKNSLVTDEDGARVAPISDDVRAVYLGYTVSVGGEVVQSGAEEAGTLTLGRFAPGETEFVWRWNRQYRLSLATSFAGPSSGIVSVSGGAGGASDHAWVDDSATVTIKATPGKDSKFLYWSGDVDGIDVSLAQVDVTMGAARTLTAVFGESVHVPVTVTAVNGVDTDWSDAAAWENGIIPQEGDTAVFSCSGATKISLTARTPHLAKIVISNSSASASTVISCQGWDTCINAAEIVVGRGGVIESAGGFYETEMSNRVWLVTKKLTVEEGGKISADRAGWAPGNGPSRQVSRTATSGGSYGGISGEHYDGYVPVTDQSAKPYGSVEWPYDPGSGCGLPDGVTYTTADKWFSGGGAVFIDATGGDVTVNGLVTACGNAPVHSSWRGGSGGGILIVCNTIDGAGTVTASATDAMVYSVGGGGGRLAVHYDPGLQSAKDATCAVAFRARGGCGCAPQDAASMRLGEPGSLYFTDNRFLSSQGYADGWKFSGVWHSGAEFADIDFTDPAFSVNDECLFVFFDTPVRLGFKSLSFEGSYSATSLLVLSNATIDVETDVNVSAASLQTVGCDLNVGGDVNLGESGQSYYGGRFRLQSGKAKLYGGFGARARVDGAVNIPKNALFEVCTAADGSAITYVEARDVNVLSGGKFSADALGYGLMSGPGCLGGHAASHGGRGSSTSRDLSYLVYGDERRPLTPGSGTNSRGGGVVYLKVSGRLLVDGRISADAGSAGGYDAGGAGGSVLLDVERFLPSTGSITACGGSAGYGGGGGRVAVYYSYGDLSKLTLSAAQGDSYTPRAYPSTAGTVYVKRRNTGFRLIVR